jgi:hypothetical protein
VVALEMARASCPFCGAGPTGGGRESLRPCPLCGRGTTPRLSVAEVVHNMAEVATDHVRQSETQSAFPVGLPAFQEEMGNRVAAMLEAAAAEDWGRFMMLCSANQRTDVLARVAERIHDDAMYWAIIRFVWSQEGHFCHLHPREWRILLSAARPGRQGLMTPDEQQSLAHLPAEVTGWRGSRSVEDSG